MIGHSVKRFGAACCIAGACFVLLASAETSSDGSSGASKPASGNGGASSDTAVSSGKHDPNDDVEIAACTTGSLGFPEAKIKITNHSSDASNYLVTVAFESPDGGTQIDTSIAVANNLLTGQSTTVDASSFTEAPQQFKCRIADVTRLSAG